MLSRVQSLDQLNIVDLMDPSKISVNDKVMAEAARMWKVSANRNPCRWMSQDTTGLKVCSLNTRSLRKHVEDIRSDPILLKSHVLCLQETWLEAGEGAEVRFQLEGYQGHFVSEGHGKGLAVYVREELEILRVHNLAAPNMQLSKFVMRHLDIITCYRSQEEPFSSAAHLLQNLIDPEKDTLVVGDFNYCPKKEENDLSNFLCCAGFHQLVTLPTHIRGGLFNYQKGCFKNCTCHNYTLSGILDHAHHRGSSTEVAVATFSHYFSDHDSVTCVVTCSE